MILVSTYAPSPTLAEQQHQCDRHTPAPMERTRLSASSSWDTRAFANQPVEAPAIQEYEQQPRAAPATAGDTATADPPTQLRALAPRFTIRPPSRLLNGKYTMHERSSPPPHHMVGTATSSSFESSSAYGTQGMSGSDSDASMDAEVASLTSGRRLGSGVEGLVRKMVGAPARPTAISPRIRDAESAVSLFALLAPSPADEQREARRRRTKAAAGGDLGTQQEDRVWCLEPEAKRRRRTCSSKVPDPWVL